MKKVFFCLLMVAGIAYSSFYEAPAKRISVNLGVLKDFNYTERIIDGKIYEINGIQRITDDYIYLENYKNGKQLRVDNLGEFSFSENQRAEDINRGFYIKNKDILKKGGSVEVVNIKSDNSEELVGTINQKYLDMYIKNKESGLILSDINGIKVEGEKSYIVIEFDITDTDSQKKFYVYEGYKYISYVMVIDLQTKKIYDEEFEINDRILSNIIYYDKYKDGLFQLENGNIVNELILNDDSTITKKQKGVLNNREHLVITKNSNEEFAVVDEEFIAVKKR
ncbi:hypothetical protein, partial [uncultured Clostridium sp.]|uniref:hypothetical protein n=1 Tax=uncultured Clostridium sp. TaxID=59620 RepID=UPI0026127563